MLHPSRKTWTCPEKVDVKRGASLGRIYSEYLSVRNQIFWGVISHSSSYRCLHRPYLYKCIDCKRGRFEHIEGRINWSCCLQKNSVKGRQTNGHSFVLHASFANERSEEPIISIQMLKNFTSWNGGMSCRRTLCGEANSEPNILLKANLHYKDWMIEWHFQAHIVTFRSKGGVTIDRTVKNSKHYFSILCLKNKLLVWFRA